MKNQVTIEYLLVSSFILTIVVISFLYSYSFIFSRQQETNSLIIEDNIRKILREAEIVYLQGFPAKSTLSLNFPLKTKIFCNNTIIVYYYLENRISRNLNFPIVCNLTLYGSEKVVIKAETDYVNITKV